MNPTAFETEVVAMRAVTDADFPPASVTADAADSDIDGDPAVARLAVQMVREPEMVSAFADAQPTRMDEVVQAVETALRQRPMAPDLYYHAARLFEAYARPKRARVLLDRVLHLRPHDRDVLILRARLLMTDGLDASAAKDLQSALGRGADYPDVRLMLGDLHARCGEIRAARESYQHALRLNPNYAAARERLSALETERNGNR